MLSSSTQIHYILHNVGIFVVIGTSINVVVVISVILTTTSCPRITVVQFVRLGADEMARTQTRGYGAKDARKADAAKRNSAWQALSTAQEVASLDSRLGVGIGAKRQRVKLALKEGK